MTQELPNYVEYRPPADGVAPPYWREGMKWTIYGLAYAFDNCGTPDWRTCNVYLVPPEALTAPNETAVQKIERVEIIVGSKRKKEVVSLNELARLIKGGAAIYGITLEPPKDWATELWADLLDKKGRFFDATRLREHGPAVSDKAAIALIRERVVLKEGV